MVLHLHDILVLDTDNGEAKVGKVQRVLKLARGLHPIRGSRLVVEGEVTLGLRIESLDGVELRDSFVR